MYNCILDQEVPPYRAIGQCKTLYCGMSSAKHFLCFKVHYISKTGFFRRSPEAFPSVY